MNEWSDIIETWNIDRWQCEVVQDVRIITLGHFFTKLSPLFQYLNQFLSERYLVNEWSDHIETWNVDRWHCEGVQDARIITLGHFVEKLSSRFQYFNNFVI